jgi:hypothetical protein
MTDAESLVGMRVRCVHGEVLYGVLRAITPLGWLIIADERGHETLVEREDVRTLDDARYDCEGCGALVNRVFAGRCAECTRMRARGLPVPWEACEVSGCEDRAVYHPGLRHWWCPGHRGIGVAK